MQQKGKQVGNLEQYTSISVVILDVNSLYETIILIDWIDVILISLVIIGIPWECIQKRMMNLMKIIL